MGDDTKTWLGTAACVAVVFGIFCFTGSACVQNADKLDTEKFNACVGAGGSWIANGGRPICFAKQAAF